MNLPSFNVKDKKVMSGERSYIEEDLVICTTQNRLCRFVRERCWTHGCSPSRFSREKHAHPALHSSPNLINNSYQDKADANVSRKKGLEGDLTSSINSEWKPSPLYIRIANYSRSLHCQKECSLIDEPIATYPFRQGVSFSCTSDASVMSTHQDEVCSKREYPNVRPRDCVKVGNVALSAIKERRTANSVIPVDSRLRDSDMYSQIYMTLSALPSGERKRPAYASESELLVAHRPEIPTAASATSITTCATARPGVSGKNCGNNNAAICSQSSEKMCKDSNRPKTTNFVKTSSCAIPIFISNFVLFFLIFSVQLHQSFSIPIRWNLSPFSDCDVTCGRGIRTRSVVCRQMPEGGNYTSSQHHRQRRHGRSMPDMMCPAPRPHDKEVCSQSSCSPSWVPQPWSVCNKSCGRGSQHRESWCMQKLGTGDTVQVSSDYCSRKQPASQRLCNLMDCSPRYIVRPWSQCLATCGESMSVRKLACVQWLAGRTKPSMVPMKRCFRFRRPKLRRVCQRPKCVTTSVNRIESTKSPAQTPPSRISGPVIQTSDQVFVQKTPQPKVRLQVGSRAYVFAKTTVVVKCRVKGFEKKNIKWHYNGRAIRHNRRSRLSILKDGSLRILYSRLRDSGKYTCVAQRAYAHIRIKIMTNTTSIRQKLTPNPTTPDFDIPSNFVPKRRKPKINQESIENEFDVFDLLRSSPASLRPVTKRHRLRKPRPVMMAPSLDPPPRLVHPKISYVAAHPVMRIDLRQNEGVHAFDDYSDFQPISDLRPLSNEPSPLSIGSPAKVVNSVAQFLHESGIEGSSDEVNELLEQLLEMWAQRERGHMSDDQRRVVTEEIIPKLNLLLERTKDHSSSRSSVRSTDSGSIERIIRILQDGLPSPASINPQPTLAPLQLAKNVVAYVGGNLIIADAEKLTLLCEASGIPKPDITWYRDGIRLVPDNKRQFILGDGSFRLLYPQFSDAGTYSCVASNPRGNDTQTTELSVTQVPHIMSTTSVLENFSSNVIEATVGSNIRAKLGARIKIRCPTQGYPDPFVVWRKDGPGLRQNSEVLDDNSLEIFPSTTADQGLFGCEATNPAGSDYQASSLVLIDPPRISEELSVIPDIDGITGLPELLMTGFKADDHKVKTNSSVMMGCPVTGFPEPKITWFFNDQPLTLFGVILDYQLMQEDKVLQIPNAGPETEGTYSCHAQNEGGNLTTRLKLKLIVYSYEFGENTPCTASCGDGGMQHRRLSCMEDGIEEVDEWYCTGLTRPILTLQLCNRIDCPPRFVPGLWSQCSSSCGNGTRTRATSCVIFMSDGTTREVAAEACLQNETRPIYTETCYQGKCPQWLAGPWRQCSRKCLGRGVGGKMRRIHCVSGNGTKLHPKFCIEKPKPRRKSLCPNSRCEPTWTTSPWSACSQRCGTTGIKTRILNCVYRGRPKQSAGSQCLIRRAPSIKMSCNRKNCPSGILLNLSHSTKAPCVDRFRWCRFVKKRGRCPSFQPSCCKSCR